MHQTELIMRRRNVLAFIKADPISLVITRPGAPLKNNETGGYIKSDDTTLPPQLARIVPNRRRYFPGLVNSEAGDIPKTDYLLLGMHDLDLAKEDTFVWMGEHYKVDGIHEQRIESTLAAIMLRGPINRHA